jgi:hypothetical protein
MAAGEKTKPIPQASPTLLSQPASEKGVAREISEYSIVK